MGFEPVSIRVWGLGSRLRAWSMEFGVPTRYDTGPSSRLRFVVEAALPHSLPPSRPSPLTLNPKPKQ